MQQVIVPYTGIQNIGEAALNSSCSFFEKSMEEARRVMILSLNLKDRHNV